MSTRSASRLPVLRLVSVVWFALGVLAAHAQTPPTDQVLVCHRSPDNPSNFTIIAVEPSVAATHVAHGDHLVAAERCDDRRDNDCDGLVDLADGDCQGECAEQCDARLDLCNVGCEFPYLICPYDCESDAGSADQEACVRRCDERKMACQMRCGEEWDMCMSQCSVE